MLKKLSALSPKLVPLLVVEIMWQKRQHNRDEEAPPAKRLKDNIIDLYGSGDVPADRAQELLEDAGALTQSLGSGDLQEMRRRGSAGSDKNVARDLRRKLLKGSHWPPIYVTMIRMWSVAEKRVTLQKVALLLPHELLQTLKDMGSSEVVFDASGLDTLNQKKYGQILEAMHGELFIPVSLWGDGVPFSWDRKKSADLWCLSLPGQGHKPYRDLRLTLTSLPHENVIRATQDDLMDIFAWSFAHLARGHFPWTRHDEQPWTDGDAWRKKRAGKDLVKAALMEVKGDWKQMSFCFSLPTWSSRADRPICWLCNATKQSLKTEHGVDSGWMQPANRLGHFPALERILANGGDLSPLWKTPWMHMEALRIDWLHVADQGITPVFMGGLFHMVITDKAVGPNISERLKVLWADIRAFYARTGVVDKLHDLTETMIKPKKGSIELGGSGAQVRALVPFGRQLVDSWTDLTVERGAAKACMHHLANCYDFLSPNHEAETSLLTEALGFQRNLQGLHLTNPKRWQIRPKLHLFLELAFLGGPPSASWNYREESYGGSAARQSHRLGGWKTPLAMSRSCLTKFCSKERVPRLAPPA